jgi:hypothetical protein
MKNEMSRGLIKYFFTLFIFLVGVRGKPPFSIDLDNFVPLPV